MDKAMAFSVRLTEKDAKWFLAHGSGGRLLKIVFIVGFAILSLATALAVISEFRDGRFSVGGFVFEWLIPIAIVPFLFWLIHYQHKRVVFSDRFTFMENRYEFDDEGLRTSSEKARANLQWSDFHLAMLFSSYVLLYLTPRRALVIPKEQVDPELIAKFEETAKLRVKRVNIQ